MSSAKENCSGLSFLPFYKVFVGCASVSQTPTCLHSGTSNAASSDKPSFVPHSLEHENLIFFLSSGFVISAICELERNAIQLALGSFYPTLLLSGKCSNFVSSLETLLHPLKGNPS